jgi:hypothetical protein
MSVNRFCGSCGSPLVSGASFCGQCGTPVPSNTPISSPQRPSQPIPAQAPLTGSAGQSPGFNPMPNPSGEQTLGVIPNLIRKTSVFSQASFCGIVTNRRIIFAQVTNEMLKQESQRRRAEGKSKGEGWLSAAIDGMTVGYDYYKRYLDMPLANALNETPGNFSIDLSSLNAVRASRGARHMQKNRFGGTADSWDNGKLEMVAAGVEYNFQVLDNNLGVTREILGKAGIIVK